MFYSDTAAQVKYRYDLKMQKIQLKNY